MGEMARTRLAGVVVVALLAVPLFVLFVGGGDGDPSNDDRTPDLRIERGLGGAELVVYVEPKVNVPARAGGRTEVVLECVDSGGKRVIAQDEGWPLSDTGEVAVGPHAHMALDPSSANVVQRCRLEGTQPLLEGVVR